MDAESASSCGAATTLTIAQIQQLSSELSAPTAVRGPHHPPDILEPYMSPEQLTPGAMLRVRRQKDLGGVPGLGDLDH